MIKNYLLTALRNIKKHKGYSMINIAGLAVGMAACLLILQYVRYELSYDRFHEKADRMCRLKSVFRTSEGKKIESAYSFRSLGPTLKNDFPEVEEFTRVFTVEGIPFIYKDARFYEKILYVDQAFLKMFSFSFLKGDPAAALSKPKSLVITESIAKKYFGDEDPIGKVIRVLDGNEPEDDIVDGVIKDVPKNTHIKFDILCSINDWVNHPHFKHGWKINLFYTYILLRPGTSPQNVEAKIPKIVDQYMGEELKRTNKKVQFILQPLKDIHLYSNIIDELEENGDGQAVNFLLIIAVFILVIAWINYINLSTSRALGRAREVGLRKVVGASRRQLAVQFFLESLLLNLIGAILSILIVLILIPYYNEITGSSLSMTILGEPSLWLVFFIIFIIGSFFSGLYPSFVLSSFKPDSILKGRFLSSAGGNTARKFLVVFQMVVSIALVASTLTVSRQIKFMKNQDLGFDKENVLLLRSPVIPHPNFNLARDLTAFKTELLRSPLVENFTFCFHVPGHLSNKADDNIWRVKDGPGNAIYTQITWVQFDYLPLLKLKLKAGRDFSRQTFLGDLHCALINETLMKILGYQTPEEALGDYIVMEEKQYKIIGVVKDYHYYSLKKQIEPRLFLFSTKYLPFIGLRLHSANLKEAVAFVKKKWEELIPGNPFDYFFLDELFDHQYNGEKQFEKTFGIFSIVAIFIACIGLFGLSSYTVLQRTKEIGIRKVFGAKIRDVLPLLLKSFAKLTLFALCLSLPLTYWGFSKWLEDYAYRTEIGWWFWVIPIIIIIPIILITVSYNVLKVAYTNPANSLRHE